MVYARRTTRQTQHLESLALALGGRPSADLASKLGLATSRSTQIRILMNHPLPTPPTPRVLGVDDFSLKKGLTYGTLLVDLETHRPIEVLKERTSETLGNWLKVHPGIEIISRDRASSYAQAARLEAPHAIQIADRFHLLKNLYDHLQRLMQRKQVWHYKGPSVIQAVGVVPTDPDPSDPSPNADLSENESVPQSPNGKTRPATKAVQYQQESYAKRRERYEEVIKLTGEGLSNREIAREMGLNRNSVNRYVAAGSAEVIESKPRLPRFSKLEPYKDYLWQRWTREQPTIVQLHQELTQRGYRGSIGPIRA